MTDPVWDALLPPAPESEQGLTVRSWRQHVVIPTYRPLPPSRFPALFRNRVYQGSSGSVYPLPFYERIDTEPTPVEWDAIHLENPYVRLLVLPGLGGRIHFARDLKRGYDFFYRQDVIKPALVGLAGPWISGGVEFNWPQHHRPATFLPVTAEIERDEDGSVTVWCGDHDPMQRMRGLHGIRLRPDRSWVEVDVRLHNRTELTQTFHWWANVAAEVGDNYQTFFPPDVTYVADHANRATVAYPRADGPYYGIDYPAKVNANHPDADRLDWYRNIPVPTSYMVLRSHREFFGGYDHGVGAGFVHWAPKEVSPGKKQWTWGNEPFGRAWDRNLSDSLKPYIELMAGVYTNNQPDFTFLAPGETKAFTQLWYPFGEIGVPQEANREAAVALRVEGQVAHVGVAVTTPRSDVTLQLSAGDRVVASWRVGRLEPGAAFAAEAEAAEDEVLTVTARDGNVVLASHTLHSVEDDRPVPPAAAEPAAPETIGSADQLYVIGSHLDQYRHATRSPEPYWLEALRRDAGDQRCNVAMGTRRYRSALYEEAEGYLEAAVARSNLHNLNPRDGEGHYLLGLTLLRLGKVTGARDALARAAWDDHWVGPAELALGRISLSQGDPRKALWHLERAGSVRPNDPEAMLLTALALRGVGPGLEADARVDAVLALDPLHPWARHLTGERLTDPGELLDVALEFRSIGYFDEALAVLTEAAEIEPRQGGTNVAPLVAFHWAWLLDARGEDPGEALREAGEMDPIWCLPVHLDDVDALRWAIRREGNHALAHYLLGCWLHHYRRWDAAREHWLAAESVEATPLVLRNLGLDAFNNLGDGRAAARYYARAAELAPDDAQLLSESDQLDELLLVAPAERLGRLESRMDLVTERDELCITYARLLILAGRSGEALQFMAGHRFQPAEGGEGRALAAWEAASLIEAGNHPDRALNLVEDAIYPPPTLGEARHPLENAADLWLSLGQARERAGDEAGARDALLAAARSAGDFQSMAVTPHSEQSFYSIVAAHLLGDEERARTLTDGLSEFVGTYEATEPTIDFFATSLPQLLLFVRDPSAAHNERASILRAQLALLDGDKQPADEAQRRYPHDLTLAVSRALLR